MFLTNKDDLGAHHIVAVPETPPPMEQEGIMAPPGLNFMKVEISPNDDLPPGIRIRPGRLVPRPLDIITLDLSQKPIQPHAPLYPPPTFMIGHDDETVNSKVPNIGHDSRKVEGNNDINTNRTEQENEPEFINESDMEENSTGMNPISEIDEGEESTTTDTSIALDSNSCVIMDIDNNQSDIRACINSASLVPDIVAGWTQNELFKKSNSSMNDSVKYSDVRASEDEEDSLTDVSDSEITKLPRPIVPVRPSSASMGTLDEVLGRIKPTPAPILPKRPRFESVTHIKTSNLVSSSSSSNITKRSKPLQRRESAMSHTLVMAKALKAKQLKRENTSACDTFGRLGSISTSNPLAGLNINKSNSSEDNRSNNASNASTPTNRRSPRTSMGAIALQNSLSESRKVIVRKPMPALHQKKPSTNHSSPTIVPAPARNVNNHMVQPLYTVQEFRGQKTGGMKSRPKKQSSFWRVFRSMAFWKSSNRRRSDSNKNPMFARQHPNVKHHEKNKAGVISAPFNIRTVFQAKMDLDTGVVSGLPMKLALEANKVFGKSVEKLPLISVEGVSGGVPVILVRLAGQVMSTDRATMKDMFVKPLDPVLLSKLRHDIDLGIFKRTTPLASAHLIRCLFREMQPPLLNCLPESTVLQLLQDPSPLALVHEMPEPNASLFRWLIGMFTDMSVKSEDGSMKKRLGVLFAPCLVYWKKLSAAQAMGSFQSLALCIEKQIDIKLAKLSMK